MRARQPRDLQRAAAPFKRTPPRNQSIKFSITLSGRRPITAFGGWSQNGGPGRRHPIESRVRRTKGLRQSSFTF